VCCKKRTGLKGTYSIKVDLSSKRVGHFKQVIRSLNSVFCVWKKHDWVERTHPNKFSNEDY